MHWWTSYLPSSPESLSRLEWGLYIFIGVIAIIGVLLGLFARGVAQHKARIIQMLVTKDIAEAKSQLAPRRITADNKNTFINMLNNLKGQNITIARPSEMEAANFANDIISAFTAAGIEINVLNRDIMPHQYGVVISTALPPDVYTKIYNAFKSINIESKVVDNINGMPFAREYQIIIGLKPPKL